MAYEMLLSPLKIGTMELKNRTVMTAAEVSLGQTNGCPTEKLMDYYEERAKGGVALIIPGVTRVNDNWAASTYTQLAMSHDYHIEPMREFAERIHRHGSKLGIQLHHPGRQGYSSSIHSLPMVIPMVKVFPGLINSIYKCTPVLNKLEKNAKLWPVQTPTKLELANHGAMKVKSMSRREVKNLVNDFIEAAVRCQKAGVDVVELHGGHGYIIQQFISPNTNQRTDEYGGSFENRMRFITEIIDGIRDRCGKDYPLMVRLTADEMYARIGKPGKGYDVEYGKLVAKRLEELGVDAINVTSACYDVYNYWLEPTSFEPGWRKYLCKEIKSVVSIPVGGASVIRTPEQAEQQLQEGTQDFVGSARTFLCDPHWVKKAEEGRPEEIRRCIGCLNCIRSFMSNAWVGKACECALNVGMGNEREYNNMPKDGAGRKIVVIGAGPAGLTAAQTMAMRGFDVTVLEKAEKAGGQVITASTCNLKDKLYWSIEDLMVNAQKAGAEVRLGVTATAESVAEMKPYAVVVAVGGVPLRPRSIPGLDRENVCVAPEIIMKEKVIKDKKVVVVGSGMTGLETTEILNEDGNSVTIIEMAPELAPGTWFQLVDDEMERISKYDTKIMLATKLLGVEDGGVLIEDVASGVKSKVEADEVVLSLGVRPAVGDLITELVAKGVKKVVAVGDAKKSGTIADACHSAYDTVMKIK
ncbi:MAG: FAD-dependent oxidoreductase [Oscillospiraceae bacterium]|nr:FAD-dependent oxidoreductase [Oscillospiraceae bacterium]